MDRQCKKNNNKQFTYGQTVQKNCTGAFTVLQTVQKKKKKTSIYIWTDSAKNNSNLHMDRQCKKQQQFTYGQTVQKTTAIYIWTVHIYRLYRRQCAKYSHCTALAYSFSIPSLIFPSCFLSFLYLFFSCTHPVKCISSRINSICRSRFLEVVEHIVP